MPPPEYARCGFLQRIVTEDLYQLTRNPEVAATPE